MLPLFQRQLLEARHTDLLETAPGHATRCVRSPFTEEYAALKADLAEQGVPSRDAWEQLETLNVGRLRLASKGIERVGADLRPVGEDRQLTEGMFMAGEVAVLRSAVTTIAELHTAVGEGANAFLRARAAAAYVTTPEPPAPEPLDIAIVGMACMFPQAPDLASFWANVLVGADAVTEVPPQRWDTTLYFDPEGQGEKTPSRWGGFLPEIGFDPLRYGIPPSSLASIEPVQLLALEAAHRALADAGYGERAFDRTRTSVVFGAEAGSDLSNAMSLRTVLPSYVGELPPGLDERLPKITEDSFPGVLANVIAGRIANRLDLGGANYTVDAACASSLTAVDVACKELTMRHQRPRPVRRCGPAQRHQRLPALRLRARPFADRALGHVRQRGRRHRARRRRRLRRAEAPRRRRTRRRPRVRRDQGRRRGVRRARARADGAPAGGPAHRADPRLPQHAASHPRRSGSSRRTAPAPSSATGPN